MVGVSAVGKSSLVRRYVDSRFTEKYFTNVGVKVDKKPVDIDGVQVDLSLWDVFGEDEFQKLKPAHLGGASGYLLVVDGTRKGTLDQAMALHERVQAMLGATPAVLVMNKADLVTDWDVTEEVEQGLRARGWEPLRSSAKTGEGVEEAFLKLTREMLRRDK
jgi:small GTP-binding protein